MRQPRCALGIALCLHLHLWLLDFDVVAAVRLVVGLLIVKAGIVAAPPSIRLGRVRASPLLLLLLLFLPPGGGGGSRPGGLSSHFTCAALLAGLTSRVARGARRRWLVAVGALAFGALRLVPPTMSVGVPHCKSSFGLAALATCGDIGIALATLAASLFLPSAMCSSCSRR